MHCARPSGKSKRKNKKKKKSFSAIRPLQTYAFGMTEINHKNSLTFPLKFPEGVAY
jgi:hypothetical protein